MVMEFLPTDKPLLHNLNNKGPVEVFELFFDDRIEKIYNFTNTYAVEKAAVDWRILNGAKVQMCPLPLNCTDLLHEVRG